MAKPLMRNIVLRHYKSTDGKQELPGKTMLRSLFQTPKNKQNGATIGEMREVGPILDLLEATPEPPEPRPASDDRGSVGTIRKVHGQDILVTSGEAFQLTESQWKDLKERIANFGFQFYTALVVAFVDDIENAENVEMLVKKDAANDAKDGASTQLQG